MKLGSEDSQMTRREAIIGLGAVTASALLLPRLPSNNKAKLPIHFIGLGSGGCRMINHIIKNGAKGKFTCISNSDDRSSLPGNISFINFISITGIERRMYDDNAWDEYIKQDLYIPDSVFKLFNKNEYFALFSSLGKYTGTNLNEHIVLMLYKSNRSFTSTSALSFKWEGKNKNKAFGQKSIEKLAHIPNFKYMEMDEVCNRYGNLSVRDAFSKADEMVFELYKANQQA